MGDILIGNRLFHIQFLYKGTQASAQDNAGAGIGKSFLFQKISGLSDLDKHLVHKQVFAGYFICGARYTQFRPKTG
jgi:hypothetical protein